YRLSTVEINLPPLRERGEDIHLLFRKFSSDFAHKYKMPAIRLTEDAAEYLMKYRWDGNIRQLRNIAEQISVMENNREIDLVTIQSYLPHHDRQLPSLVESKKSESDFSSEREILYKFLFDMKSDLNDLKKLTLELLKGNDNQQVQENNKSLINKIYGQPEHDFDRDVPALPTSTNTNSDYSRTDNQDGDSQYVIAETIEE